MPEAHVHASIHSIGRSRWDECCASALERFDYLAAVEDAALPGFQLRYLTVEDGGALVAAVPAFMTRYSLDTTLTSSGRKAIAALRRLAPSAFTLKLGAIGSPCTETAGLAFAPHISAEQRPAVLRLAMQAFEQAMRESGCGLLAIKDAPAPETELWAAAIGARGFKEVSGLPTASLDIDFGSMTEYLSRLSSATRKDMRRKLGALEDLDVEIRSEIGGDIADIHKLYEDTRGRAAMQFEYLTPAYFTGVLSRMAGRAMCVLYRNHADRELLAANLLIHDEETLLDKFFCMDGVKGRARNLYFVSWFTNIRICIERGFRRYQSGQAGYADKLRLGSKLTGASMFFRHRNPVLNAALHLAAPLLSEPQPEAA